MSRIYADDTLIYDSTLEDHRIAQGTVTLEADKAGSFVFSVYPDHFYYDSFVRLKTIIMVKKGDRIVFRGRVLNDVTDYWNNKVLTCEGELNFLQDTIVRPFDFTGTPEDFFRRLVSAHNEQVDEFKRFNLGTCTVVDTNNYIARSNTMYESTLANLNTRLLEDATGGHLLITHGEDGSDPVPTIHYLAVFTEQASQTIEFGENLRDIAKTVGAEETATAIIPLGATTDETPLTIASVNDGVDFVYSPEGVEAHGWVFKTVEFPDVTVAENLKTKALEYLASSIGQTMTIDLNAIDRHLLDRSFDSIRVCEYVRVVSEPHGLDATMLCNRQTLDLLNPANDTVTLGYAGLTFTETSLKGSDAINKQLAQAQKAAEAAQQTANNANAGVEACRVAIQQNANSISLMVSRGELISAINMSEETIRIQSGKIQLEGAVTVNNNFMILSDGTMYAQNGIFNGSLNGVSGTFTELNAAGGAVHLGTDYISVNGVEIGYLPSFNDLCVIPSAGPGYGNVGVGNYYWDQVKANSHPTASSLRYKKDVITLTDDDVGEVDDIRVVTYALKNKDNGVRFVGAIAEELAETHPLFVQYDDDGLPESIDYSRLAVLAIYELQKLRRRVAELESKLEG